MIIRAHKRNYNLRKIKWLIKDRELNGSFFYYKGLVVIYLIRKDGFAVSLYFEDSIEFADIYLSTLKYLAEHGGIEQWQIPKN